MTQLLIANIGSYPRIGEQKDQQRHRRGKSHFLNKEISAHAMRDVNQSVALEIIREQLDAGLDEITDGLISWDDPISHFCQGSSGIENTELARYFHTNFYYRVPRITARPKIRSAVVAPEFEFAQANSSRPVRAVVTGPVTLAHHTTSSVPTYSKMNNRVEFFTDVVNREITALAKAGAKRVQVDEPSLTQQPDEFRAHQKALVRMLTAAPVPLVLSLFYAPVTPALSAALAAGFQALQLDMTWDGDAALAFLLKRRPAIVLGLGAVNAADPKPDAEDNVLRLLRRWRDAMTPERMYLTPSVGLEALARDSAAAKLKTLARIRDAFGAPTVSTSHAA